MEQVLEVGDIVEQPLDAMQSVIVRGVFDLWADKRGTRRIPLREDFTPRFLLKYLPHLHLVDVKGPDRFQVRLCGTAVAQILGGDTTGVELTRDDTSILKQRTLRVLQRVLITQAPVLVFTRRGAAPGTRVHRAESVWLPLSNSGSTVDQILSATATEVLPEYSQKVPLK